MNITIHGIEFTDAAEAIGHTVAAGCGVVISVRGRTLVVERGEAERLAAAGVAFAYVTAHEMPDGTSRIMTVPVND